MIHFVKMLFQTGERRPFLVTTLLVLFILIFPSVFRTLHLPDEARYAEVSRDMLEYQNWLVPHINGIPHLTKPPLFNALGSVFFFLLGENIFSIRLVSIMAFLASLYLCIRWTGRRRGTRGAVLAGLIGATIFQSAVAGHFADLNMLLTLWLTGGLLFFYDAIKEPKAWKAWVLSWIFFGLAFLTKGPPAFIIPACTILLYRLISAKKLGFSVRHWLLGIGIYIAISFPWYIYIIAREGERILEFWGVDVFRRTMAGEEGPEGYPGFYLLVFLLGGAPWSFLGIREMYRYFQKRQTREEAGWVRRFFRTLRGFKQDTLWLVCWIAGTILPFSLLLAEIVSYIQPSFPALGLLLAFHFAEKSKLERAVHVTFSIAVLMLVIPLWGWSVFGSLAIRSSGENPIPFPKHMEPQWIAHRLGSIRDRPFTLVQYDDFSPAFNFFSRRRCFLVEQYIHREWPTPPELFATREDVAGWVERNRPVALILEPKRIPRFTGGKWSNLRMVFRGEEYIMFMTPSLIKQVQW